MTKSEYEVLAEFRYHLRRIQRYSEEAARRHGVTLLQYQLLLQIKGYPGREWVTVAELAERLQAQHHGVVALLSRCEDAGWVSRSSSASDLRVVEIRLTKKGGRCLERLAKLHRDEHRAFRHEFASPGFQARRAG